MTFEGGITLKQVIHSQTWEDDFGNVLVNVHHPDACADSPCPLHNPTDHSMRGFKQLWREDRGIMERICEHGVGHPDPDDLAIRSGLDPGVHGCCGCCSRKSMRSQDEWENH